MTTKKYNIAQIHWGFPPVIGGVETHLALMCPEMVRRGHNVSLLTGAFEGMPDEHDYEGMKVYRNVLLDLNWLYKRGLGALQKDVEGCFNNFIEVTKPDVIHAHNMHYFMRVHTRTLERMAKDRGIPLVLTAHNVWDDTLYLELTRDVAWDHIIAVSYYIRDELIGIGCDPKKTTALHHGINTQAFKPGLDSTHIYDRYPQLKGRKVIFHPARMGLGKGCDLSIKALNIIKKQFPDALLMMAGNKNIIDWGETQISDVAYFVDLVKHFNLHDDVVIDSYALEDMPYIYNIADVILYPSTAQEPFGMTMLESMACKKPIIVTAAGGMPEIIMNNENGYVIPVKNFNALADCIADLLANPDKAQKMGETGYQMVQDKYTEGHVTEANLGIYDKVV